MRKFDELRLPQSCLNRAEAYEPLFVLLGRDESAIAAIDAWINHRVESGKNLPTDPQIMEARICVSDFRRFASERAERIAGLYQDAKE